MERTKTERMAFTQRYVNRQEWLYKTYNQHVWETGYSITKYRRGQWRNHSFCNTGGCDCCRNPRKVKWNPLHLQRTLQERRHEDSFNDQLQDYFNGSDC